MEAVKKKNTLTAFSNSMNKAKKITKDNYETTIESFQQLKPFIKDNGSIWDPFYSSGLAGKYLKEVFPDNHIFHREKDCYTNIPKHYTYVITNPPFSDKFKVIEWLIGLKKIFFVLLPFYSIQAKQYKKISGTEKLRYIIIIV